MDKEPKLEEFYRDLSIFDELTDEEVLYWSSPYFDELQFKKEEHKRKIEEQNVSDR